MSELPASRLNAALEKRDLRILLSNDDGIHAPGLKVLERIARRLSDDIWVVAPETDQSGASHSLTLSVPLRLRELDSRRFAVLGTPTDCVMMAVRHVLADRPPDLVLSGVNRGSNIAEAVTYSGTVAAAMEGTLLGIPSVALSQTFGMAGSQNIIWATAEHHAPPLLRRLIEIGWPRNVLLNINFPDAHPDEVTGVEVTVQGQRDQSNAKILQRVDGRGVPYYWIGYEARRSNPPEGTDLRAIYDNRISVTPLHLNLTEPGSFAELGAALGQWTEARPGGPVVEEMRTVGESTRP